ncbi:hypothetical protein J6590_039399 [Homalodisca vitripennis]|nr:hypothetical protein J6590_039399 [Homalodisca vitripennis]
MTPPSCIELPPPPPTLPLKPSVNIFPHRNVCWGFFSICLLRAKAALSSADIAHPILRPAAFTNCYVSTDHRDKRSTGHDEGTTRAQTHNITALSQSLHNREIELHETRTPIYSSRRYFATRYSLGYSGIFASASAAATPTLPVSHCTNHSFSLNVYSPDNTSCEFGSRTVIFMLSLLVFTFLIKNMPTVAYTEYLGDGNSKGCCSGKRQSLTELWKCEETGVC